MKIVLPGYVLNTEVVVNFMISVLTKFQHYWTFVPTVIAQTLHLGLLKNSQFRVAVNEFFDPPNLKISYCDEYQKCRGTNYIYYVKNSEHFGYHNVRYEFSCNRQCFCKCCYHNCYSFMFRN